MVTQGGPRYSPDGKYRFEIRHLKFDYIRLELEHRSTRKANGSYHESPEDRRINAEAVRGAKRRARNLPSPKQIKKLLDDIGLSPHEASKCLGGGPRAFNKYIAGTEIPSKAMGRLLWILRRYSADARLIHEVANPRWYEFR
jgi:hypothetical protein